MVVHGEARDLRWKAQVRIGGDGSVSGQGSVRSGRERARGNVVGTFDGARLELQLLDDQTVTSYVKRIRRKFEAVDPAFDAIETVYGLGYRFVERD